MGSRRNQGIAASVPVWKYGKLMGADDDTIRHVGILAAQGMRQTERVILKIMTE